MRDNNFSQDINMTHGVIVIVVNYYYSLWLNEILIKLLKLIK